MTERRRIGDICFKDVLAFVFRCLGVMLFPILLLMPFIVVWRIFVYVPEDFWSVIRFGILYVVLIVLGVWLSTFKTLIEYDDECLYIVKKRWFLFVLGRKQVHLSEIRQITFAEIEAEDKQWKAMLKKVFRLKLIYGLIYKIGSLLMNRGRLMVCLTYGEQENIIRITDIRKNDERYLYLQGVKEQSVKE